MKRNVIQHKKHKKTKAGFSCLLRHPAWKQSGSILKVREEISKEKVKNKG